MEPIYYEREWIHAVFSVVLSIAMLSHAWRHKRFLPLALCFTVVLTILWTQDCYVWKSCSDEVLMDDVGSPAIFIAAAIKYLLPWDAIISYFTAYFSLRRISRPWMAYAASFLIGFVVLVGLPVALVYLEHFITTTA